MRQEGIRVLVIDDAPEDRETYRRFIERGPWRRAVILETDTGEEGLRLWRTERPDCVLLDYELPDLTGIECLARIAAETGGGPQPVIMLTGQGSETVAVEAMKLGCQDYLAKNSLSPALLTRAMFNAVEKVGLHRRIEEQQREIEEFTCAVSHDLKAPIVSVQGFARMLADQFDECMGQRGREYLRRIMANCATMENLLHDLQEFSRIGRIEEEPEILSMEPLVRGVFDSLAPSAQAKGITLRMGANLPDVHARRRRVVQVITNLVDNAIKYMPSDRVAPWVEVGYEPLASVPGSCGGALYVRDNGAGIPEKLQRRVFEIFARGVSGPNAPEGSGIGLAVVRRIVAKHGGTIWIDSPPDQGATFYLTLPLAEWSTPGGMGREGPGVAGVAA